MKNSPVINNHQYYCSSQAIALGIPVKIHLSIYNFHFTVFMK